MVSSHEQPDPLRMEEFVALLTKSQRRLYAFIFSLVGRAAAAEDVLQETNLILWKKASEFRPGSRFDYWAGRVAYYQVMAYRKRLQRDKLIFSENMIKQLAAESLERDSRFAQRTQALRDCLQKLPADQKAMVSDRYAKEGSVKRLAHKLQKSVGAISQTLFRIRQMLHDCVTRTLDGEEKA